MAKKGVRAIITRMRPSERVYTPIPRDRDNTDDLQDAEVAARARHNKFPHPDKTRKGSFDPGNNSAFNGNSKTFPKNM